MCGPRDMTYLAVLLLTTLMPRFLFFPSLVRVSVISYNKDTTETLIKVAQENLISLSTIQTGTKMADATDTILFPCFPEGAEFQLCIQSEAAGGSHICRHLCVCAPPSKKQQTAFTGLACWNELSFFGKNRNKFPGTELSGFFSFRYHARVSGSQWVIPLACTR